MTESRKALDDRQLDAILERLDRLNAELHVLNSRLDQADGLLRITHELRTLNESLQAAEQAESEGISVEVVDPRTLLPLDEETIVDSVKKTTRCVTAHEAVMRGGFGAELTAVVQHGAFDYLDAPIERVGAKFAPLPFAPVMEQYVIPHAEDVLEAIRRTVARS